MDTERKRAILSWVYLSDKWLDKVLAMKPNQIHVIYMRMLNRNQLKGISDNVKIRTRG